MIRRDLCYVSHWAVLLWLIIRAGQVHVPSPRWQNQSTRGSNACKQANVKSVKSDSLLSLPKPNLPALLIHSPMESEATTFTYLQIPGAPLQITIYNWWIMASIRAVLLLPLNQFKQLPSTVRMAFLFNGFMRRKKIELYKQHQLLWRFVAEVNVNIPSRTIVSNAEATVGHLVGNLVMSSVLCERVKKKNHAIFQTLRWMCPWRK